MKDRRHHRSRQLFVEQAESRLLLSSSTIAAMGRHAPIVSVQRAARLVHTSVDETSSQGQGPQGNATDFFTPTGTPTRHEVVRQKFFASFVGEFTVGPGRYSSQSQSFYFRGGGKSTFALHSDIQLGMVTPKDTTRPLSGLATQFDRNVNTNYTYGVDLAADQVTGVDRFGRPTHITYTTDLNISSGIAGESRSEGTIDIKYLSNNGPSGRASNSGRAVLVMRGSIYSLGAAQILRNAGLNA